VTTEGRDSRVNARGVDATGERERMEKTTETECGMEREAMETRWKKKMSVVYKSSTRDGGGETGRRGDDEGHARRAGSAA
jgi:hypothetical protein